MRNLISLALVAFGNLGLAQTITVAPASGKFVIVDGDNATVNVTSTASGAITLEFFDDPKSSASGRLVKTMSVPYATPNAVVNTDPGFAALGAKSYVVKASQGGANVSTTLAYRPFGFPAPGVEPADFDAFWNTVKSELAAVAPNYQITPLPAQDGQFSKAYKVVAKVTATETVTFFMAVPRAQNATGPNAAGYPAMINFPAFGNEGNSSFSADRPGAGAERGGAISLNVSIHEGGSLPSGQGYPGEAADRNTNYFRLVLKRCMRVVDFVKQLNDPAIAKFDGTDIMVWGESQGGGLSKMVAGLRPNDITLVFTAVDAYSAHGYRPDNPSGFPGWVESGKPEAEVAYYDAVYHARRIKARKIYTSVGLTDDVAVPASQFAGLAQLSQGQVQYVANRDLGHANPDEYINGYTHFGRQNMPTAKVSWPYNTPNLFDDFTVTAVGSGSTVVGGYSRGGADRTAAARKSWRQLSGPGTATFASPSSASTSVSATADGTYVLAFAADEPRPDDASKHYLAEAFVTYVKSGSGGGGTGTTADTQAPTVPTNVRATAVTQTTLTLNWDPSTDNVGVVDYSITGATTATVTSTSRGVTGLTAGQSYTFRVSARDAAGNVSGLSTPFTVTMLANPPPGTTRDKLYRDATAPITLNYGFGLESELDWKSPERQPYIVEISGGNIRNFHHQSRDLSDLHQSGGDTTKTGDKWFALYDEGKSVGLTHWTAAVEQFGLPAGVAAEFGGQPNDTIRYPDKLIPPRYYTQWYSYIKKGDWRRLGQLYGRIFSKRGVSYFDYVESGNEPWGKFYPGLQGYKDFALGMREGLNPAIPLVAAAMSAADFKQRDGENGTNDIRKTVMPNYEIYSGLSSHPYPEGSADSKTAPWEPRGYWEQTQAILTFRDSMAAAGRGNLPVDNTEIGWPSNKVGEQAQASYELYAYLKSNFHKVRYFHYGNQDPLAGQFDYCGFIAAVDQTSRVGRLKPLYYALRKLKSNYGTATVSQWTETEAEAIATLSRNGAVVDRVHISKAKGNAYVWYEILDGGTQAIAMDATRVSGTDDYTVTATWPFDLSASSSLSATSLRPGAGVVTAFSRTPRSASWTVRTDGRTPTNFYLPAQSVAGGAGATSKGASAYANPAPGTVAVTPTKDPSSGNVGFVFSEPVNGGSDKNADYTFVNFVPGFAYAPGGNNSARYITGTIPDPNLPSSATLKAGRVTGQVSGYTNLATTYNFPPTNLPAGVKLVARQFAGGDPQAPLGSNFAYALTTSANFDTINPTKFTATNAAIDSVTYGWDNQSVLVYGRATGTSGQPVTLNIARGGVQQVQTYPRPFVYGDLNAVSFALGTIAVAGTTAAPTADTEPPSVPGFNNSYSWNYNFIEFAWEFSTDNVGVAGYEVQRSGDPNLYTVGPSVKTYNFSNLQPSTTYSLSVRAFDAAGNRSAFYRRTITTTATPVTEPPIPSNPSVGQVYPNELRLQWDFVSGQGVEIYEVYRVGSSDPPLTANYGSTGITIKGLQPSTTYEWDVLRNKNDIPSVRVRFTGTTLAPTTPTPPPTVTLVKTVTGNLVVTRVSQLQPIVPKVAVGESPFAYVIEEGRSYYFNGVTWVVNAGGSPGAPGAASTVPGPAGAPGQSAYQLWLSKGNAGTEAQFLASLKGANGASFSPDNAINFPEFLTNAQAKAALGLNRLYKLGLFSTEGVPGTIKITE